MLDKKTINATTAERKASEIARFGNRYYEVDHTYDKRVYENTPLNYAKIVGCLILFWICNALHWWGCFSFGIVNSDGFVWYSLACFIFTVCFLAGLLVSGKYANALKRQHEFYLEKIAELKAEENEKKTKAEQEKAHEEKLAKQAAKLAQKQNAEGAKQTTTGYPALEPVVVTNIQDAPVQGGQDQKLLRPDAQV